MESTGITPVMNVGGGYGYGDGFGSYIWLFAILALMNGGFGGFGNGGRVATVEDLNNQSNFTRLESQVQGIGQTQLSQFNNITNAISTLGYETLKNFNSLGTQMAECCCGINRNIDGVNYNIAEQANKILSALKDSKIEALQSQVSQLQLNQALCGVVRYPTSATYNAGYPFYYGYNCGCGCNTNI